MDRLLYIIDQNDKTVLVTTNKIKEIDLSFKRTINQICVRYLCTLTGRIEAIKKLFKYKYNVPIYVNDDILLIKINDQERYWINIIEIQEIKRINNQTEIRFIKDRVLIINKEIKIIKQTIKKAQVIINYKNDLFFK